MNAEMWRRQFFKYFMRDNLKREMPPERPRYDGPPSWYEYELWCRRLGLETSEREWEIRVFTGNDEVSALGVSDEK